MKALFVCPKLSNNDMMTPLPLGPLSIVSYLSKKNFDVKLYDNNTTSKKLAEVLDEYKPDYVGISVVASKSIKDAVSLSKIAKKKGVPVVWGGAFASSIPSEILKENFVDCIIIGEGEKTWEELLLSKKNINELFSVNGLAFKDKDGNIVETPERELLAGNELPPIDYTFIDPKDYFFSFYSCKKVSWICDGKGCHGKCTFCYNQKFNKGKYRKRSYDYILKEIRTLVETHGADGIYFSDELWCRSAAEMKEYCDAIKSLNLNFVWGCFMRVGILSAEDYKYMYDAGCRWICFGIESGSPKRLKAIKKGIDFEDIRPSVRNCSESGIVPWLSFIVGFPDETPEELVLTIELMKEFKDFSRINLNFYKPYVGSEMYQNLLKEGKIKQVNNLKVAEKLLSSEWIVINQNYSQIPTLHLKVISAFASCWAMKKLPFVLNNKTENKKFDLKNNFVVNLFRSAGNMIRGQGFLFFVLAVIRTLRTFFFALFFPHINKKYRLKF